MGIVELGLRDGEWRMEIGEWGMGNGKWEMGNGKWEMRNGEWGMGNGEWGMGNGEWEMGNGKRVNPVPYLFILELRYVGELFNFPQKHADICITP